MRDNEEDFRRFEENSRWLQKYVAPDDIYDFAEQAIMSAEYFLLKLVDYIDLYDELKQDKVLDIWVRNLMSIRIARKSKGSGMFNTELKNIEDM